MNFSALPKIELHLHLDCSLSFDVVSELNPEITQEQYRRLFVAPDKCRDLADYIRRSENAIVLMQTKQALRLVVEDLFTQLEADNVIYAEMRFAPLEHTRRDLAAEEVVETVTNAVEEQVEATGIEAGVILCTLRHYSEQQSMETVKMVEQFEGSRVVGFDIAADEAGFSINNHISAFEYAGEKGLNRTAHAGEARGATSVWETLEHFKPSRIGHGVRSSDDAELMKYLKDNKIHLEICPTSNIQTNVYGEISDHTVDKIYRSDISLSINTDTRTISDVTLAEEYQLLADKFSWKVDEIRRCNLEAIEYAFTDEQTKERLRRKIVTAYQ